MRTSRTRPHCSRMCTARFGSYHYILVLFDEGVGPQANKFEHISGNDHQMSVAGGGVSQSQMSKGTGGTSGSDVDREVGSGGRYPTMLPIP